MVPRFPTTARRANSCGVIRQNPQTGERSLDLLQWGLIPYWCKEKPKRPPINAKAETVDRLPMFLRGEQAGTQSHPMAQPTRAPRSEECASENMICSGLADFPRCPICS